jgi:hypothetical protein
MEQHAVPQHLASFEFKLFGNLTVRQFVTLAIPMTFAALFLFSNLPVFLRYSMAVLFGVIGLLAALVPIQGRPLDKWAVLFIKAIMAPTQRIWVKDIRLPEFLNVVISKASLANQETEPITGRDREKLKAYLRSLPKGQVSPFDVKEQIAVQRLNLSMDLPQGGKLPPAISWVGDTGQGRSGALPSVNQTAPVSMAASAGMPVSQSEYRGDMASALPSFTPSQKKITRLKVSAHAKPYVLPGIERRMEENIHYVGEVVKPKVQLASDTNFTLDNIIPIAEPGRKVKLLHGIGRARARKLHFAPPAGFDLSNLPIRGEARFEVSEGLKKTLDPSLFADEPEKVIPVTNRYVETSTVAKPVINIGDSPSGHVVNIADVPQEMAHQAKLPVVDNGTGEQLQKGDTRVSVHSTPLQSGAKPAEVLSRAQIVPLTNKPNVLSGLIVDNSGGPIAGAIITVRDGNGVPVRALKTNKLGQFLSATPLPTGEYMIDVDWESANFEPLSLNVAGEVLSPLAIKPKA